MESLPKFHQLSASNEIYSLTKDINKKPTNETLKRKEALPNSLFFDGIVIELQKNSDCKITEQGKIIHKLIGV